MYSWDRSLQWQHYSNRSAIIGHSNGHNCVVFMCCGVTIRAGRYLGYARLRVTYLLQAEAASGSAIGAVIAAALAAKHTVPIHATLYVIRKAIETATARRFLLDGYPRVVNDGYPTVHDQVR